MAKITTKIKHTLLLSEAERLTLLAAVRYKANNVPETSKEDALITILQEVKDG